MIALLIWASVLAVLFYYYAIRPMSYWRKLGVKQGRPTWFFGESYQRRNYPEILEMVYNRFPDARYSGMYQFTQPNLLIRDLKLIKDISVKDFDHFTDHSTFTSEEGDLLWSRNLFALKGQKWKDMRPILSPAFTSSKMKSMFLLMTACVENFVKFHQAKNQDVVEVEFRDISTRLGNDIIATTAFGVEVDSLVEPNNEFYLYGKKATDFTSFWMILKFVGFSLFPKLFDLLKISLFSADVSKFFIGLVEDNIRTREEKGIVRPDMIHLMMEARKGKLKQEENGLVDTGFATVQEMDIGKATKKPTEIANIDIAAQAMVFFLGGFDSLTTLMSFAAYELALHPDIQERLRKEINETQEKCEGMVTYEAMMTMKYMDMVISETMRKWPNGLSLDRVCTKPYTIQPVLPDEKPFTIPEGTTVQLPLYAIHRDPQYYPDPEKFDPERFSDENKHKINPYAYFPFGLGPRNCIGSRFALLETKVLFFHLLQKFEIVPVEKTTIPPKLVKGFVLLIEGGFHLGLKTLK